MGRARCVGRDAVTHSGGAPLPSADDVNRWILDRLGAIGVLALSLRRGTSGGRGQDRQGVVRRHGRRRQLIWLTPGTGPGAG